MAMSRLTKAAPLVAVLALGACFNQQFVDQCEAALRARLAKADELTVVDSRWTRMGRDVKAFVDYDLRAASGETRRLSARCVFDGERLAGIAHKKG